MAETKPSLPHLRFGLIALGDQGLYPDSFAAGGDRWDEVFTKADAQRVGEILRIDASSADNSVDLATRSEEHTSELQSLMRISYAVFCLKKKKKRTITTKYNMIDINTNTIKQ